MYDVIIVGAGPAGCKTAEKISRKGYNILVIEEHSSIGKPVQCTGLVSKRIGKLSDDIIVNKIKKARFCSGEEFFEVGSKDYAYVIDREKFDKSICEEATAADVFFKTSTKFIDYEHKKNKIKTSKSEYEFKVLVGADGPNSTVAKKVGIELPKNILFAKQVKVNSEFNADEVELWFDAAPGFFAWVVPENDKIARVGLMTNDNPTVYLEKFIRKRFGRVEEFDSAGDVVRYGLIKKSVKNNVLLVGDAACQIKPFSAGGLVYGQIAAKYASEACIEALEKNDFSEKFFTNNYDDEWKKELSDPIKRGMFFKKLFSTFGSRPIIFKIIRELNVTSLSTFLDMDFLGKD